MKILVTGNEGFIGQRLMSELYRHDNFHVIGMDVKNGNDILYADLPNDIDYVFHLAAQAGAIPSMEDPVHDARQNILCTIRIAKKYAHTATRIIYTTSGGAISPESPYGLSKKTGEEYLKMLAPDNTVICRLSSIYGDKPRGVVDTFIRGASCNIMGDGSSTRDFVHVDDIARGLVKAMKWDPGEYSMGSGIPTTVEEVARATGKEIEYLPSRKGEIHTAVLPNTTPDWKPERKVLDYVRSKC